MKGIAPFVEGILLISIALIASSIVGYFILSTSTFGIENTKTYSGQAIDCSFSNFFVKNASFDAGKDCTSGVNHTINVSLKNNGQKTVEISNFQMQTISGSLIRFDVSFNISPGAVETFSAVTNLTCTDVIRQNATLDYVTHLDKVRVQSGTCPLEGTVPDDYTTFYNANQTQLMAGAYGMALWHFNSSLDDSSAQGNDGSFVGGSPTYDSGIYSGFGNAIQFDGTSKYVDISSSNGLDITDNITIEVWVKSYTNDTYVLSMAE